MHPHGNPDTICALATANGVGAIAVIRVSGKDSLNIVSSVFSKELTKAKTHTIHFGTFRKITGELIDEVLVAVFEEGKSFTGEESVEISCHGSVYIQQQIIATLLVKGCRIAEPGEFTMRAFLNGKMDLSQAEAVADLISSMSKNSHEIALKQLRGRFSSELKELREKLIHFASMIELELDFAEEDVEFADRSELKSLVNEVLEYVRRLASSFELGNAIKNGVPVAIVGAPNSGKSTLLNQLLGEDRAIVSEIAGTTRDIIEETLNIEGILFRLIDTAGIREHAAEEIEAMGIKRSFAKIDAAKIILVLTDINQEAEAIETVARWVEELKHKHPGKKVVVIGNKRDLSSELLVWKFSLPFISISAKSGQGVDELKSLLVNEVIGSFDMNNETIVTNVRHFDALKKTEESLEKAKSGLENGITGDFVAMDIRQAMYQLGSITGDISTEDLLSNIFSKFCIGK